MSCPSHTTINIAIRAGKTYDGKPAYRHFFKVDVDRDPQFCKDVIDSLREKYPSPQFEVDVTYWECTGTSVE